MSERNLREVFILRYLTHPVIHPNIIRIDAVSFVRPPESYNIKAALELAERELEIRDLDTIAKRKRIFYQLFRAITYCHSKHIVHNDLKLPNILYFSNKGKPLVKISDFGLSTVYFRINTGKPTDTTLWYKSPEALKGETDYDERIDVWALGMLLFGAISGRPNLINGLASSTDNATMLTNIKWALENNKHNLRENLDGLTTDPEERQVVLNTLEYDFIGDNAYKNRYTAAQVLAMPYFDSVRDEIDREIPAPPILMDTCSNFMLREEIKINAANEMRSFLNFLTAVDVFLHERERPKNMDFLYAFTIFNLFRKDEVRKLVSETFDYPSVSNFIFIMGCLNIVTYITEEGSEIFISQVMSRLNDSTFNRLKPGVYNRGNVVKEMMVKILTIMDCDVIFPTTGIFLYQYLRDMNLLSQLNKCLKLAVELREHGYTLDDSVLAQLVIEYFNKDVRLECFSERILSREEEKMIGAIAVKSNIF